MCDFVSDMLYGNTSDESYDDSSWDNYDENSDNSEVDMVITPQGHHVLGKDSWRNVTLRKVDKVPYDIDGLCVYSVTATTRMNMLEKCRDGRPWKHDSRTTCSNYMMEHEDYSNEQAWLFHTKESPSAQCTSVRCKKYKKCF